MERTDDEKFDYEEYRSSSANGFASARRQHPSDTRNDAVAAADGDTPNVSAGPLFIPLIF